MNLDDFLHHGGTNLASVVAEIDSTVGLDVDDVLLAVGSLVEGLGNTKSDLDIWLITPRAEHLLPRQDNIGLVIGRCLVDVKILRLFQFDELLARFDTWSRAPWDITHATNFTSEERVLLHRLLHGRLILHNNRTDQVTVRRPTQIDVARLKLHVARHISRTIQVDMIGYRDSGDYRSLVFAAQELLGHAIDALLAGYQLTNPLSKWRSRMLDFVPSNWERSLPVRPTGLTVGQIFWQLHRAPEQPDDNLSIEHAFRITTFARAVFVWAELQLLKGTVAQHEPVIWAYEPAIWSQLKSQGSDNTPLPTLDFDVDFLLADGRVTVARLNEFGETVSMSMHEFALCLLFDGTTTAREAEFVVYGSHGDGAVTSIINRLTSLLG